MINSIINSLRRGSLEQRRADARLIMFYKNVYGLVAIPLPTHIQRQVRMTMHPMHFIQIQTTANYYKYSFFPLAVVQWNNLPSQAVLSDDLSLFRSTILQPKPYHVINPEKMLYLLAFNFLLLLTNTIWAATWQKQTKWVCAERRLRSAWASAQSDQSPRCPHEESLGP